MSVFTLWTTTWTRLSSYLRDRAEVWRLTEEFHSAIINRDRAALERILSDDFVSTNTHYISVDDRTELVKRITTRECDLVAIKTEDVWETVGEARAEVSLKIRMPFRCGGGETLEHEGFYRYSFERRDGRWQITSLQLTPVFFH